eukprot:scaffold282850_cov32-Tisochrysis_lutea.AAC.1
MQYLRAARVDVTVLRAAAGNAPCACTAHLVGVEQHDVSRLHPNGDDVPAYRVIDIVQHGRVDRTLVIAPKHVSRAQPAEARTSALRCAPRLEHLGLRVQRREEAGHARPRVPVDGCLWPLNDLQRGTWLGSCAGTLRARPSNTKPERACPHFQEGLDNSLDERARRGRETAQRVHPRHLDRGDTDSDVASEQRRDALPAPQLHELRQHCAPIGKQKLTAPCGGLKADKGGKRSGERVSRVVVKPDVCVGERLRVDRLVDPLATAERRADTDGIERVGTRRKREGIAEAAEARLAPREPESPQLQRARLIQLIQ